MNTPEVRLPFPAHFELQAYDRIPRAQEHGRALRFPGGVPLDLQQELAAGPILGVRPTTGDPWVGVFAGGGYRVPPAAPSQVVGWPDGRSFCVVFTGSAYVVRADDPTHSFEVDLFPICDVSAIVSHELVVFADFTDLIAYGAGGLAWRSGRLVLDGLEILAAEGDVLHVRGSVETVEFTVDLGTGSSADGPFRRNA
jgi:hypothetical protein